MDGIFPDSVWLTRMRANLPVQALGTDLVLAAAEQAPIYSVQRFIARNGDDRARTVYLDGLDEYRPRTSSRRVWLGSMTSSI